MGARRGDSLTFRSVRARRSPHHDAYQRLRAARKKAAAISDPAAKRKAEAETDEIGKEVIKAQLDEGNWDEADRIAA